MPKDTVSLEFTQEELRIILAVMNHAFRSGGLGTGDVLLASPVLQKLQDKVIQPPVPDAAPEEKN